MAKQEPKSVIGSVQNKGLIQVCGSSGFGQRSEQRGSFSFVAPLGSDSVQKKKCSFSFVVPIGSDSVQKTCSFSFVVLQDSVNVQSNGVHSVLWLLLGRTAFRKYLIISNPRTHEPINP